MRPAKSVAKPRAAPTTVAATEDVEANSSVATGERAALEDEEEEETPQMNTTSAVILLIVVAALIGVTSEWLVDSISGVTSSGAISQAWVGLILLPIVGNAAEHVTAIVCVSLLLIVCCEF